MSKKKYGFPIIVRTMHQSELAEMIRMVYVDSEEEVLSKPKRAKNIIEFSKTYVEDKEEELCKTCEYDNVCGYKEKNFSSNGAVTDGLQFVDITNPNSAYNTPIIVKTKVLRCAEYKKKNNAR